MKSIANESTVIFGHTHTVDGNKLASAVSPEENDVIYDNIFTDCVLLFCFFALLGSFVFSRGSKKVLFWRTVQEQ